MDQIDNNISTTMAVAAGEQYFTGLRKSSGRPADTQAAGRERLEARRALRHIMGA